MKSNPAVIRDFVLYQFFPYIAVLLIFTEVLAVSFKDTSSGHPDTPL